MMINKFIVDVVCFVFGLIFGVMLTCFVSVNRVNKNRKVRHMDVEDMMIDYIMNNATREETQEFFGYMCPKRLTIEECRDTIAQMPDEEFDMFTKKFNIT